MAHLEQRRRSAGRAWDPRRKHGVVLAADHQLDDFVVGLRPRGEGRNAAAVAKDGAFVGQLGNFVHPMRNVDQSKTVGAKPPQYAIDLGHVSGGQGRRGFVENQDARLARERLGDLDHLPARQRKVLDECQRMDVIGSGTRERLLGDAALRPAIDQAEAARRVADRDIVGDGEVGDEGQLLKDAGDAGGVGRRRRRERDRRAIEQHPALVGRHHARHDLDKRRLAGAVLAQYRVDAASLDREVGVLERAHTPVALGHAAHCEQGHGRARGRGGFDPSPRVRVHFTFASVCPMISCAVKLMPQVGNELPTKKLSLCAG